MSALTEAARAALEALETVETGGGEVSRVAHLCHYAIEDLRAALAADEAREPVAWVDPRGLQWLAENPQHRLLQTQLRGVPAPDLVPLYAYPPAPAAQAEQPSPDDWQTEVFTLMGHAEGLLAEGKREMPAWCYALAEKIARAHIDEATAERVRLVGAQRTQEQPDPAERGEQPAQGLADERAAFEAWCTKRWGGDRGGDNFLRQESGPYSGEYVKGNVQFAWSAWQGRAPASAPRVPQGWKLVPVEPTPQMLAAIGEVPLDTLDMDRRLYAAAIGSAPNEAQA